MVSAKFNQLFEKTRGIQSHPKKAGVVPSNDEQLDLYAYGKIAKKVDFNDEKENPKPSFYDLTRKAKRNKWQHYLDEGVTPEDAEKKYIELAEKLISTYGDPTWAAS